MEDAPTAVSVEQEVSPVTVAGTSTPEAGAAAAAAAIKAGASDLTPPPAQEGAGPSPPPVPEEKLEGKDLLEALKKQVCFVLHACCMFGAGEGYLCTCICMNVATLRLTSLASYTLSHWRPKGCGVVWSLLSALFKPWTMCVCGRLVTPTPRFLLWCFMLDAQTEVHMDPFKRVIFGRCRNYRGCAARVCFSCTIPVRLSFFCFMTDSAFRVVQPTLLLLDQKLKVQREWLCF